MTKTLTLDLLKELLKEQANVSEKEEEEIPDTTNSQQYEAIQEFYQQHGIIAPIQGMWKRPIPASVYKCPLSEPMTTLVPWDSLPRTIQGLYEKPTADNNNNGGILEVHRNHLMAEEGAGDHAQQQSSSTKSNSLTHGLQRRPIGGNLTNKLTEYTRGQTGQAKPFLPGGINAEEIAASSSQIGKPHIDNPYLTPEAIEKSLRVLKQGSKASWYDGSLITAPPGVDFKVGLSYEDIYGTDQDNQRNDKNEGGSKQMYANVVSDIEEEADFQSVLAAATPNITRAIQWDQSFLDDDSLFGSSDGDSDSESSSGSSKNDDNAGEDGEDEDEEEIEITQDVKTRTDETITGSDEDIDKLLNEFTQAEARTKNEIMRKETNDNDETAVNPLRLAERQAQLQNDTTRKTWASTALLPIEDFHSYIPNPAMKYPFTLDSFQQQAVARLERNESVFVGAHTSAGKTVVAEYAVALARQRGTRCIYTSPIKALSNQKFRDFSLKFGAQNVGLVTGDLQVNVDDSTCLIMTTEILRSMLYRGADLIRDIEYVVFDECHYINSEDRGVVYEEVIIMLPAYVNLIFLSATTPNTFEFSDWVGRTKRKPIYVLKTNYRPVPLSHYLWANLKLHLVKEGNGGFLDKGYQEGSSALRPKDDKKNSGAKGKSVPSSSGRGPQNMAWQAQGGKPQWMSLIRFLEREELTPTVVFAFSKKKCEETAHMLSSLDLNTASERSAVQGFTIQTVARLSPVDALLPQVQMICEMVTRGIGVHHGGLLPILKEMVEVRNEKSCCLWK
jgi:hypothetical protein